MSDSEKKLANCYLGIDLGSSYTKFVVIENDGTVVFKEVIATLSRNRDLFNENMEEINRRFDIQKTCSTGYGRDSYSGDMKKTELICASAGVSALIDSDKSVIDIGGEDIKIIESGPDGAVIQFFMNDKCSAGTGAFITEIAEKAELEIAEMDGFARQSTSDRTINSFCTVFAKTEILGWKFKGVPIEDIARGIYLSIVDRIAKMPIPGGKDIYLCGGVIAFHPYLRDLLAEKLTEKITIISDPQYMVALGAAELSRKSKNI